MPPSPAFETLWPALSSPLGADLLRQDAPYTSLAQAVHEGLIGPAAVNHKTIPGTPPALAAWWMDQFYKPLTAMADRHENLHQRDTLGIELVNQGYLVTQEWMEEGTPADLLQLALTHGHVALAQALDAKVDFPLLLLAARRVSVPGEDICRFGESGNPQTPLRLPALHSAIAMGYVELAQWLLDKGVSADALDDSGQTPLFQATSKATVDILLRAGASPGAVDKWGCSVFDRRMPNHAQVARVLAKSLLDDPSVTGISQGQRLSALLPQIDAGISLKLLKPQLKALGNDVSLTVDTPEGTWSLLGWIAKAQACWGRSDELLAWAMDKSTQAIDLPCGCTDLILARDVAWAYFDHEVLAARLKKYMGQGFGMKDFKEGMLRVRNMNKNGPNPSRNNSDGPSRAMARMLDVALLPSPAVANPKHAKLFAELFDFLPITIEEWTREDANGCTPLGRWFGAWADYLEATDEKPLSFAHHDLGEWRLARHVIPSDVAGGALRVLAASLESSSFSEKENPDACVQSLVSLGTIGPWQTAPTFTQELAWWVNLASAHLPGRVPVVTDVQWENSMNKMKKMSGLWSQYAYAWDQRRLEAVLPFAPAKPKSRM